jgi:endonuclease-3
LRYIRWEKLTSDCVSDPVTMDGRGTYTLVCSLDADADVTFGAAGERRLSEGTYAYVGTALGPGGFSRVDRHRELARGERDVRHWHVDYLLSHPASSVTAVVTTPSVDAECRVAATLRERVETVPDLGASDCDCGTHLFGPADHDDLTTAVEAAHGRVRGAE